MARDVEIHEAGTIVPDGVVEQVGIGMFVADAQDRDCPTWLLACKLVPGSTHITK